ncbi:MAG: UPF0182 family protein [Actinobacteria bacterium HGW-Actinobacteria-1]|jgi:hypothetical protein|nr:MAG: UPF0182 family protein [Actinobacteria bacterium HGW-Actinobacteria-1]
MPDMTATSPRRARPVVPILIGVIVLLFAISGGVATFYTDALWYNDLGQSGVFWTRITAGWVTGIVFFALFFVILYVNVLIARRMAPKVVLRATDEVGFRFEMALQQVREVLEKISGVALVAISAVAALISGAAMSSQWTVFRLAMVAVPFGEKDPQFGRDLSFYFFTMPALRTAADWLMGALAFTLVVTAVVHVLTGAIRPWARLKGFDPHVKAHLSVLAGLMIVVQGFKYWLDIFELSFSPRGQVLGASYTDVHAQIPAYQILIVIAVLSGIALMINIRFKGWRLPAVALGVWVSASILVGGIYPALIQQFRVSPNEVAAEAPYIERNIAMTRKAFKIEDVTVRAFPAEESLTASAVAGDTDTIKNVRLWDPSIVSQSYQQLQGIRPYYDFVDVDVDRYTIDGERRQVLVSLREMNVDQLAEQAKTWVNQHLVYTHGYGAVVSPVNESSGQGLPKFMVRDIPPTGSTDLKVDRPAVYYGELTNNYVVAATQIKEFDYPVGDQNATTSYEGKTGIAVGNIVRRAAFALRFSAPQMLFSSYITPDSKVLFRRSLNERIGALAPFLTLDRDPYAAIIDGKLVWIVDAYTTSDRYPYSERIGGVNYMRNSVKITVDAYDGTVTMYAFDETDPLLATWRAVFPDLIVDGSEMPDGVRAHLRYPEDLFRVQAEVYKTYHMLDPLVFYNKEDQWALPGEADSAPMDPFYVLMKLPQEPVEDFMLMLPFTPRNKDNMIGWMSASSDPANYGRRIVYTFPKQKLVLGPQQVSARVNQDPIISQQLTLWNQRGSGVLFGNMLVIPIENSIVYIQPLYLQAEQTAMPQLTRVLVAYGDSVAMQPDLTSALAAVFGAAPTQPTEGGTAVTVGAARELYLKAIEAQKAGDWAAYGSAIDELGKALEQLSGSAETTVTP